MDRGFVGLDIAVLAVTGAPSIATDAPAQLVIEKLEAAGHRVVTREQVDDAAASLQPIKAKYLEWIADAHVDVVFVIAGATSEAASEALAPLVTRPLPGFADLFRLVTFEEIGTAAMLVDVAAGQCKSTFIFVLPASVGAVRTALDRLLLPQLDYRTKPHNLVMRMPRHHHGADGDEAPAPKTPWIVAKDPGARGATLPPQLPPAPKPPRAATEPSTPSAIANVSVSQRIAVAAIARPEPVSVAQRMSAVLEAAAPPPPPARPKVKTAKDNVPLKPPAQIIPLSQLLTNHPELASSAYPAPARPPLVEEVVEELPAAELKDIAPAQIVDDEPEADEPAMIVDAKPASETSAPHVTTAAATAMTADGADDTAASELPIPVALSTKVPTGPIRIEDESTREAILAAQKRAVTERVTPIGDLSARSIAVPARKKRDGKLVAIWSVIALAAASLVVMFVVVRDRDRHAQAAGDHPPDADTRVADLSATVTPTTATDPPASDEPPREPAIPDAGVDPGEIDMSAEVPSEPARPTPVEPTANPRVAATPTRPAATPQPRPVRTPEKPTSVTPPPAEVVPEAPPVEAGCDEVSCVLDHYRLSCCAKYKPAEPVAPPVRSGLPEALDKPMVTAGIAKVKPAVIACGERIGVKGQVKISVTVSPEGTVSSASVAASPDPELGECVAAAVRRATFAKTETGGSFAYPFVF